VNPDIQTIVDALFPAPLLLVTAVLVLSIGFGVVLANRLVRIIQQAFVDSSEQPTEKHKHEPVSFFEADTEPDYVVGFGDDGELLYASEKPKNREDEA
jgi:hypothetical protein